VSWFDAARFANWMHNGQGAGDTETGAYTLNGATTGPAVSANPGAKFHIPTADEWYKAAFYSPRLNGGTGGYFVFATQRNATPGSVPGNNIKKRHAPNQANYFTGGFAVTQTITPSASQNYLADVGAFSKSASPYGTFDQAGNVYEWCDDQGAGSQRSLRGGYLVSNVADTSYLDAYILPPEYESNGSGFRLASRP
jgi:formylglycine-generating enzyme required for sulfatase activity